MAPDNEEMKECTKCQGSGKHADPSKTLVQVTCGSCGGSGKVAADTPDEPPVEPLKKLPFGASRSKG